MNINVLEISQSLTQCCTSFCIIRGKNEFLSGSYRDIDCFVRVDEFFILDELLVSYGFSRRNIRRGALFYEFKNDNEIYLFDVHVEFAIHGVDWGIEFDPKNHCEECNQIRFLRSDMIAEHAILITIYQNKGYKKKLLDLPDYEKLEFIRPNRLLYYRAQKYLRSSNSHRKTYYYAFLFTGNVNILLAWFNYFREHSLNVKALCNFGKFKIRERLLLLNLDSIKEIRVKNTRDDDLRFGWVPTNDNRISGFISGHSFRGKVIQKMLKYISFALKADQRLFIYLKNNFSSGRNILGIFFGTPSLDRSVIFHYRNRDYLYFLKFPATKSALYNARHEHDSISHFRRVQNVFEVPRSRLYHNALLTRSVQGIDEAPRSSIGDSLKKLTVQQTKLSKLGALSSFEIVQDVKNTDALEHFNRLRLQVKSEFLQCNQKVATSWAHGDLTPWNLLRTKPKYTLIDFEKFKFSDCVVGYDLVHYFISGFIFAQKPPENEAFRKLTFDLEVIWDDLEFQGKPDLELLISLVLLEYLYVAMGSREEILEYRSLYQTVDIFLQALDEKNEIRNEKFR